MSAESDLQNIHTLGAAISQFRTVQNELSDMNISSLKSAGTDQWAGQKKQQFDDELSGAENAFKEAQSEIEQAISDCQSRQYTYANAIDPIEHPVISAEAWWAIWSS